MPNLFCNEEIAEQNVDANTEKDTIKWKNLLVQSHTSHIDTRLKDFKIREAIYV